MTGRLYLTGLSPKAHREADRMTKLHLGGPVETYELTPVILESTQHARADAEAWLVRHGDDAPRAS